MVLPHYWLPRWLSRVCRIWCHSPKCSLLVSPRRMGGCHGGYSCRRMLGRCGRCRNQESSSCWSSSAGLAGRTRQTTIGTWRARGCSPCTRQFGWCWRCGLSRIRTRNCCISPIYSHLRASRCTGKPTNRSRSGNHRHDSPVWPLAE